MKEKFVVEGANFVATIAFDTEHCGCPFKEAATRVLEYVFRHGPDSEESGNFNLMCKKREAPSVGLILSVCREGEVGDDTKLRYVKTSVAAENAGLLEIVRLLKEQGLP